MKKLLFILSIFSCFIQLHAGDAERTIVRNLLRFYYVERINDPGYAPEVLNNNDILNGTRTGAFWSNPNMAGPQRLVQALLSTPANGGDEQLQDITARVLGILNKPVKVNLLDDANTTISSVTQDRYGACPSNDNKAWPCASNMTSDDDFDADCAQRLGHTIPARRDQVWAGNITLGTSYFRSNSSAAGSHVDPITSKFSVIIHELMHTQDYSDGRAHLFWVNATNYRYGEDENHITTEAIPNLAMTYKEGIANTVSLMYDAAQMNDMFNWFARNDTMLVEQATPSPGTGPSSSLHPCIVATSPSPDVWLYNQLITAGIRPVLNQYGYGFFRVRDLPARFIAHNEFIIAMICSEYSRHVGKSKLFHAIADVNQSLLRASGSGVAILFRSLCNQALPNGQTVQSLLSAPVSGPKPYLYPLALADYFTGYRANTRDEFLAIFEDQSFMQEWADLYWTQGRAIVRNAVPMTRPQIGDITSIAMALGINQSSSD